MNTVRSSVALLLSQALLEGGVDVEAADDSGQTPLMFAARREDTEMVTVSLALL